MNLRRRICDLNKCKIRKKKKKIIVIRLLKFILATIFIYFVTGHTSIWHFSRHWIRNGDALRNELKIGIFDEHYLNINNIYMVIKLFIYFEWPLFEHKFTKTLLVRNKYRYVREFSQQRKKTSIKCRFKVLKI